MTQQAAPRSSPPIERGEAGSSRVALILAALLFALVAVALLRLCVGTQGLGWPGLLSVLRLRGLRLACALIVGSSLAVSGVALQALLRNPLAEPFILGLSTGAGAGVMTQLALGYYLQRHLGATQVGATIGAGATMAIVFFASRRRGTIDPIGLLLVGVVLGTISGAFIMILQQLVPGGVVQDVARWMMGHLEERLDAWVYVTIAVITVLGIVLTFATGRAMDAATFSQAEAESLGVPLGWLRLFLFAAATVLAAGAVVLAGPIAFVGLLSPHVARVMLGPSHRALILGSAMIGAMLILGADMASSFLAYEFHIGMMPIGIFTALIGGPAFLWMLRPQLGRGVED
jgi:iron complex transport system permease protein